MNDLTLNLPDPQSSSLDTYQFHVSVGLETVSLLIATVRAVPWREHADEAVENLPIIQINSKIQLKVCLFNPLNEAESIWVRSYPVMASTSIRSAPWCLGQR